MASVIRITSAVIHSLDIVCVYTHMCSGSETWLLGDPVQACFCACVLAFSVVAVRKRPTLLIPCLSTEQQLEQTA